MKSLNQLKKKWPAKRIKNERKENHGRYSDDLINDVRDVLKSKKCSQREVAEAIKVPPQNVYRWGLKRGQNNALKRNLKK